MISRDLINNEMRRVEDGIEKKLRSFFTTPDIKGTARGMCKAFSSMREMIRVGRASIVPTIISEARDDIEIMDSMESVLQSSKTLSGRITEKIAVIGYENLFTQYGLEVQECVRMHNNKKSKRDIDIRLILPNKDVFISVTTMPQERKDSVWPMEYKLAQHYSEMVLGGKGFIFLALMGGYPVRFAAMSCPNLHEEVLRQIVGEVL